MSRTYGANVNASLIRELRMIAQQLFRHKENLAFWGPKLQKVATLTCCFCFDRGRRKQDAFAVIDGYSVCYTHAVYVRDGKYHSILVQIKNGHPIA